MILTWHTGCLGHIEGIASVCGPGDALVLMLYGTGGAPAHKEHMYKMIGDAVDRGAVVVGCTQCTNGRIDLGMYAVSGSLQDTGVISGGDMTVEAISGKLAYLLGRDDLTVDDVKAGFLADLRGERSADSFVPQHMVNSMNL